MIPKLGTIDLSREGPHVGKDSRRESSPVERSASAQATSLSQLPSSCCMAHGKYSQEPSPKWVPSISRIYIYIYIRGHMLNDSVRDHLMTKHKLESP